LQCQKDFWVLEHLSIFFCLEHNKEEGNKGGIKTRDLCQTETLKTTEQGMEDTELK